jgi:hypothetical protein
MRFRAANIGPINLINRRSNLPRLLLALSAEKDKSNPHRFARVDKVTPYRGRNAARLGGKNGLKK